MKIHKRYQWDRLNNLQVGTFAEYFVKMEFSMYGFQVYTSEVDDRGIDFVCRYEDGPYFEVQVKSIRGFNYVFVSKEKLVPNKNIYVALVVLENGIEPKIFLFPSTVWLRPTTLFADRNYEGKKSKPEWGINISKKNMQELNKYSFEKTIQTLI